LSWDFEVPSLIESMEAISLCGYPSMAKRLKIALHLSGRKFSRLKYLFQKKYVP
jgi:hypothetical protein